ncbi:hypothetical protein K505DRAFT_11801 [Melanomma pulvis-pyrius CBS 109.77]|uniref:Uncharacterized protein n=1 Tax=Melanomma pulvis-pyrius CBS 109.77 TaxID=1314802 RepID=A0A6A6XG34_9PLEO|nr:hypothetical protein K505DRAFT_11801 [Melanomma pulvis-pyrius CBS 109.77]
MALAQSLVLYRPSTALATVSTSPSHALALSTRLFTQQTGTAIATELLYRLLLDVLNRLLSQLQRFATQRLDQLGSFLEQRARERQAARLEDEAAVASGRLQIVEQVGKVALERGFVHACPMTGKAAEGPRARPGPPRVGMWRE